MESSAIEYMDFVFNQGDAKEKLDQLAVDIYKYPTVASAFDMAFVRRLCKLGLNWANEINLDVIFLESGPEQSIYSSAGWKVWRDEEIFPLPTSIVTKSRAKKYMERERVESFEPITFSEMRHHRKHKMDNVRVICVVGTTPLKIIGNPPQQMIS